MPTLKQFHKLIKKLKNLIQKDKEQQSIVDKSLEKSRINAIAKIKAIYPCEIDQAYKRYIAPFLDHYAFLKKASILTIISKEAYEPAHTLLLSHILQQNKSILSALIQSATNLSGKEELLRHIQTCQAYQVDAEVSIKDCGKITGRILDLMITDDQNQWMLIVENKIESCFSVGKIGKTQIDDYRIYAERHFREYDRYYLVVSYADCNKKDAYACGWGYCDYCAVFNAIIQCDSLDHIATDYLSALMQLLCNGPHSESQGLDAEQVAMQFYSIRKFYEETILKLKIAL